MTLIVGIVCSDAILLASETQSTGGNYRVLDTRKIHRIEFKNGEALVAESGIASASAAVIEKIQRAALTTEITKEDTISNLVKEKVRELRKEITDCQPNALPEHWRDFFMSWQANYNLMLAYYYNEKPFIYSIEPSMAILDPIGRKHYCASGIGSELGSYLLQEHSKPDMVYWQAAFVASHVLETVKEHVEGCGGKTQIGVLRSQRQIYEPALTIDPCTFYNAFVRFEGEFVYFFTDDYVKRMADSNAALHAELKQRRNEEIVRILCEQAENVAKPMIESIKSLFGKWNREGLFNKQPAEGEPEGEN